MSNTKVIAISNAKGGCGKSTVTMLLASAIAKDKKKKVLIIDADTQRTITDFFENESSNGSALVDVEDMEGRRVTNYLKRYGNDYDIIFIDTPRMTSKSGDNMTTALLTICDTVVIPVIGSQVDILSTIDFIDIMDTISKERKELDFPFQYHAFINRRNRRKDNEYAIQFLKKKKVKVFKSSLNDLKIFTRPSLYSSILDDRKGKEKFEPFYKEFLKITKIK